MPHRSFGPGMLLASLLAGTVSDAAAHADRVPLRITRLGEIRSALNSITGRGEDLNTSNAGHAGSSLVQWFNWPNWGNFWRNF
jgi:hypothetical protein